MKVQFTDKINFAEGIKALVFGEFGVGKTPLCATAPAPIILSAEEGLLSLRKLKVPFIDVSNYKDLNEAFKWLSSSAEAKNYQTPCLDSLGEIADVIFSEERRKNSDPRKYVPEAREQIFHLVRAFRDLKGKNAVIICKQILQQGTELGAPQRAIPEMPNEKVQNAVPYFFDLVLHMYMHTHVDGKKYQAIHTKQGSPYYQARDRGGNLDEIEKADLTHIFKKAAL